MNDKFISDVLNEIDESYLDEAVQIQQKNRKKLNKNKCLFPLVAGIALIFAAGATWVQNQSFNPQTLEMIETEKVYAAENSEHAENEVPEESHDYIISSNNGKIANKIYTLTAVDEMPEEMKNRIDLSEDLVMCFGFHIRVEGEGIESITFETEDTEFVKKVEYRWKQDQELFEYYPDCIGVASKEYSEGSHGIAYENCGNIEISNWIMVPAGNRYTVPYDKQGDAEYLYALKLVYDRTLVEEAKEYSHSNIEDNFQTINDLLSNEVLGKKSSCSLIIQMAVRKRWLLRSYISAEDT